MLAENKSNIFDITPVRNSFRVIDLPTHRQLRNRRQWVPDRPLMRILERSGLLSHRLVVIEPLGFHGNPDSVRVKNEFVSIRPDLPVFGIEQVANPGAGLLVNHDNHLSR